MDLFAILLSPIFMAWLRTASGQPSASPAAFASPTLAPAPKSFAPEYVDCPGVLEFNVAIYGPYCSTNYAEKNYISCHFEVCSGESYLVTATEITGREIIRVVNSNGGRIFDGNPSVGPIAVDMPLAPPAEPTCELFEARLGCELEYTTCRGVLNITRTVVDDPGIEFLVVIPYEGGHWSADCDFSYSHSANPECWFRLCPGQVYTLSASACISPGPVELVTGGYSYHWLSCDDLLVTPYTFGPADTCTFAKLRYYCLEEGCVFNSTISSRPLSVPLIEWITPNGTMVEPGILLDLQYTVTGMDRHADTPRCFIYRYDTLMKKDGCLAIELGADFEQTECVNGTYRTNTTSSQYFLPPYGGVYKIVLVDYYSLSTSSYAEIQYYVLAESAPLSIISGMGLEISLQVDRVRVGETVTGSWIQTALSGTAPGAGPFDSIQLVTVSSPDRCSPEVLWEGRVSHADYFGYFETASYSTDGYYFLGRLNDFTIPKAIECEHGQYFEFEYIFRHKDTDSGSIIAFSPPFRAFDNSPVLQHAVLSNDAVTISFHFDTDTDRAESVERNFRINFRCSSVVQILYDTIEVTATCHWDDSRVLVARFDDSLKILNMSELLVTLHGETVRRRCGSGTTMSCEESSFSPGKEISVSLSTGANPIAARLSVSASIYAVCDDIYLDPTYSTGQFSGLWKSVVWTVTSRSQTAAEIENYLNTYYGTDTASIITISNSMTEESLLLITMTLSTATGWSANDSAIINISKIGDAFPKVSIPGGDIVVEPSYPVTLFANTSVSTCDNSVVRANTSLSYHWAVYDRAASLVDITSNSKNPRFFKISSYSLLPGGVYTVVLTVSFLATYRSSSASILITVQTGYVRAYISGGLAWDVPADGNVRVDASQSRDFGTRSGNLNFVLTCSELSPNAGFPCSGVTSTPYTDPIRVFSVVQLIQNMQNDQRYELLFTLNASRMDGTPAYSTVAAIVTVIPPRIEVPIFTFLGVQTSYDIASESVVVCRISTSSSFVVQWSSPTVDIISLKPQTPLQQEYPNGMHQFYLSLPPNVLQPSVTYTLQLSVSPTSYTRFVVGGNASVIIRAHVPPHNGILGVSPTAGSAYQTIFFFQTASWIFDDDAFPVSYAFHYYIVSESEDVIICSFDPLNSCSSMLTQGNLNNDYNLTVMVTARDTIGSSSIREKNVTVVPFFGDAYALGKTTNETFSAALLEFNSNRIFQSLIVAADILNVRDCSNSPPCAPLNRRQCRNVENTCGSCLDGYVGVEGPSNFPCQREDLGYTGWVGSPCISNFSCLSMFCHLQSGLCASPDKLCTNNCSLRGKCVFRAAEGQLLDSCPSSNKFCSAVCVCETGFDGNSCHHDSAVAKDRQSVLNSLSDNYAKAIFLDDVNTDVLYRRAQLSLAILNDFDYTGYSFNNIFLTFTDAVFKVDFVPNSGPLLDAVLGALSQFSGIAKANELQEILRKAYEATRILTQLGIKGVTPSATQRITTSRLISVALVGMFSFSIHNVLFLQPISTSDKALGVRQDLVVINAEDNPIFPETGFGIVIHYHNPHGIPSNYSMIEVESYFTNSDIDGGSGPLRRTLIQTPTPVQNYTSTLKRVHDPILFAANVNVGGILTCNISESPYNASVICPSNEVYDIPCPGDHKIDVSFTCPISKDLFSCNKWDGQNFALAPSCVSVGVSETNITCLCVETVLQYSPNTGEILLSFVRGYTGSIERVSTVFVSTVISVRKVNEYTILHNLVVFSAMVGVLILLGVGFSWLFYYDVLTFVELEMAIKSTSTTRTINAFFAEVIPVQFDNVSWYERYLRELAVEHSIVCIFKKESSKDFRSVKWVAALCSIINFMFVSTVLAVLFFADDGTCEEYTAQSSCERDKSLNFQDTVCTWDSTNGKCKFQQPADSFLATITLALVITVAAVPLDFFVSLLIRSFKRVCLSIAGQYKIISAEKQTNNENLNLKLRHATSGSEFSEMRLSVDRKSVVLISTRLHRLQSEINVSPAREVSYIFHSVTAWDMNVIQTHLHTFQRPSCLQAIRGRLVGARIYIFGLPQVMQDFHASLIRSRNRDSSNLSADEIDMATVMYYALESMVLKARCRAKYLLSQLEDIESEEDKQVFLMKNFIVGSVPGIRRRVALRYFFGNEPAEDNNSTIATPSWVDAMCILALIMYVCFVCTFIFLFGASLGSRSTDQWLFGVLVGLLQAYFILEPFSILFYNVCFAGIAYFDIMRTCRRLSSQSKYVLLRTQMKMSMKHTLMHHLNPACKVACKVPHLPVSRLLISLNDLDLPTRYDRVSAVTAASVLILASVIVLFLSLPDILQDNLMEMAVSSGFNFILLGFYLFYLTFGIIGPVLLAVVATVSFLLFLKHMRVKVGKSISDNSNPKVRNDLSKDVPALRKTQSGATFRKLSIESDYENAKSAERSSVQMTAQNRFSSMSKRMLSSSKSWSNLTNQSFNGKRPRKFLISYVVVRYAGAFMKKDPYSDSETCMRFKKGADVVMDAIVRNEDHEHWLGNTQGWIPATTNGGQNILLPGSTFTPIRVSIVGTSFIEEKGKKKWTTTLADVEIVFELELEFANSGTNRIFRSYSTILKLHERLLKESFQQLDKIVPQLPCHLPFDVVADVDELFDFENDIESWAAASICDDRVTNLISDFMLPTENDIDLMEAELAANTTRRAFRRDRSLLNPLEVVLTANKAKNLFLQSAELAKCESVEL